MLAPTPTKADEQSVERMFRRAVEAAIADLRAVDSAEGYSAVYRRNVDRFHVAIRASELFVPKGEPCTTTPD